MLLGAIMSFAAFVIARDTWFSCNVMYFACGSTDYCETLGSEPDLRPGSVRYMYGKVDV